MRIASLHATLSPRSLVLFFKCGLFSAITSSLPYFFYELVSIYSVLYMAFLSYSRDRNLKLSYHGANSDMRDSPYSRFMQ